MKTFEEFKACPYCNEPKFYRMRRNKYRCSSCKREWAPRKGSILEHTRISPDAYEKIKKMAMKGYSLSAIAKILKHNYYTVYKLFYALNIKPKSLNKGILLQMKLKTNETNFSLSQNTGLSISVIAKLLSPVKKYRVNPIYYQKLFEYLKSQVHSLPSSKIVVTKKEPVIVIQKKLSSIFKQKKQIVYATDILILANLLGKNSFAKSIPEKFFHDYLYKSFIYAPSISKVILMLRRHGLIRSVNGSIYVSHYPLTDISEKKQKLLISSLSQYFDKVGNFPSAFGWALLGDIKKRTDKFLFKSICFYEQKKDIENLQMLIDSYEKKYKRTTSYIYICPFTLYKTIYIDKTKQKHNKKL